MIVQSWAVRGTVEVFQWLMFSTWLLEGLSGKAFDGRLGAHQIFLYGIYYGEGVKNLLTCVTKSMKSLNIEIGFQKNSAIFWTPRKNFNSEKLEKSENICGKLGKWRTNYKNLFSISEAEKFRSKNRSKIQKRIN